MRFILLGLLTFGFLACDAANPDPGNGDGNPPAADALDGLYMRLKQNFTSNSFDWEYLTFLPDGRVAIYRPSEGLDRFTQAEWAWACERTFCGQYTRSSDVVTVRWANGDEDVFDVALDGTLEKRGASQSHKPTPALSGLRLDGVYHQFDEINSIELAWLRLTADGRFEERNLMDHTGWVNYALTADERDAREAQKVESGSGTYAISRNTLTLRYDGGPAAYFTIVVPPGEANNPATASLYINNSHIPRLP